MQSIGSKSPKNISLNVSQYLAQIKQCLFYISAETSRHFYPSHLQKFLLWLVPNYYLLSGKLFLLFAIMIIFRLYSMYQRAFSDSATPNKRLGDTKSLSVN